MSKLFRRAAVVAAIAAGLLGGTGVAGCGLRPPTAVVGPSNGPILRCAEDHPDAGCLPRELSEPLTWLHTNRAEM